MPKTFSIAKYYTYAWFFVFNKNPEFNDFIRAFQSFEKISLIGTNGFPT